ncbi:predicted protein [Arabidopsis lyrata subsp. lyrata]|uniref:Predicted protein n=1 Tax=Arabidopsis lyrata subsp. lyrata TaxID=81972 RepID=D7MC73_ARALL|nr:predicted protein [Arabidopsis lyrata subsp. lyrata]
MSNSQQDQEKNPYLPWSPQETRTLIDLLLDGLASGWRNSSDEVWNNYIKAHPSYKKFRDETFEEFDDLKMIFGDNIATDGNAIGLGDDFSMDVEEGHETPLPFVDSNLRGPSENLPVRKKRRSNTNNVGEPTTHSEDSEEVHTEMNSLTTVTHKLFNLIQERETRQQKESEQREAEKKKNNVWEAIKEVPNLEQTVRYDAVKLIHQLGMKEVFVSMSIDELYGWIMRNVMEC